MAEEKENKAIWSRTPSIQGMNDFNKNSMIENVGIVITEIGDDYMKATMPVNNKTTQSFGILHGGASVVLAETIGSLAANLVVDFPTFKCFGLEINSNHIRPVSKGIVTGIARPIHMGKSTQVWQIKIFNEEEKLVNISRLTVAVKKM